MKEETKDKELWSGEYIALYDSGYIGVSDGVGYVGKETDIKGLYEALKELIKEHE